VEPSGVAEMKRLFGNDVDVVQVPGMEIDTVSKFGVNIFADFAPGQEPIRKDAADAITARNRHASGLDTLSRCLPAGIPLATLLSEVTKIVQAPGITLVMHELDNATRQIYTDGRPLPANPNPSWLGYSTGRWEGDTLVVQTAGHGRGVGGLSGGPSHGRYIVERQRHSVPAANPWLGADVWSLRDLRGTLRSREGRAADRADAHRLRRCVGERVRDATRHVWNGDRAMGGPRQAAGDGRRADRARPRACR
jgi:hypothetical protein